MKDFSVGGPGQRKRPHHPSTQPLSLHLVFWYLVDGRVIWLIRKDNEHGGNTLY